MKKKQLDNILCYFVSVMLTMTWIHLYTLRDVCNQDIIVVQVSQLLTVLRCWYRLRVSKTDASLSVELRMAVSVESGMRERMGDYCY